MPKLCPRICVVFDLDDTLYAERDFAVSAFGEMGRWAEANHGIAGLDQDLTALLDGVLQTMARSFPSEHAGGQLALPRLWHF